MPITSTSRERCRHSVVNALEVGAVIRQREPGDCARSRKKPPFRTKLR
jgi:hypothetical protein